MSRKAELQVLNDQEIDQVAGSAESREGVVLNMMASLKLMGRYFPMSARRAPRPA